MNDEIFETVLNDILNEQRETNRLLRQAIEEQRAMQEKLNGFDQRLTDIKIDAPPADTSAIQKVTGDGIEKITTLVAASVEKINTTLAEKFEKVNAIVEAQPKPVVRQLRFVFFPEHDYNGMYRFFLTRVLGFFIILVLIAALFTLGRDYLNRPSDPFSRTNANGLPYMQFPASTPPGPKPVTGPIHHPRQQKHLKPLSDSLDPSAVSTSPDSLHYNK